MEKVAIHTASKNYSVYIGSDIMHLLSSCLEEYTKIMLITDETVSKLHLGTLIEQLPNLIVYTTPSGEKAKTFKIYEDCLSFALKNGLDRKSVILAFGGGAVGDLAGFVAATYMRGIPFIQIPTTILAHDSAVGGKVAINHPLGKNMVGAFYQPEMVIYDTNFLHSLPERQVRSGFAEVIKHGLIADPAFLQELMENLSSLNHLDNIQLAKYLKKGIEIKSSFVSKDEKETGIRAYLNFGHTLGHAIEAKAGFGELTHGESVMCGMVYALILSKHLLGLTFDIQSFINWIEKLDYKWRIPSSMEFNTLYELMKRDKKSTSGKPAFVLLEEIGKPTMFEVEKSLLEDTFYKLSE
ncbi:3-dehydroquinate synthase [Heyndrickxia sporothermodurans]|uniref:3-dehydroquinate synthase n=1 Tax=Heyndrickxia sporothermodurans TaxID=46224 RepID=UPI000D379450|nr:3-dehydroquinate synthase [Heyndrickxia sporothermodurans]PTY78686.1 3-dehydroquinate synthase [Heyndrickxia sporothermodurans]